jgi:CPA2 family monovalent cation:H+ antiporter-2
MPHDTPLIATIVAGLALAFVCGAIAHRIRISPLVGYLIAGIAIGPYTPGFVGDQALANELAEIGVILLMFGVGLHFSLKELWSVRAIAIPGAVAQIGLATLLGLGLALALGWTVGAGIVFGLALSVASTVVLLRALQERRLVNTERGHIAVGWLVVEDIVMVLTLVLLPALAPFLGGNTNGIDAHGAVTTVGTSGGISGIVLALLFTIAKIGAFFAVMIIVGRRVIPWILHFTAHTGSRELFRLAVLTIALGVAFGAAKLFGVSFALGAFFAGMILSESELSQQAANESLPLRDAFAVLFFVSVGMLFDPSILVTETLAVIATVLIIVVGKSLAALGIVLLFRYPLGTALMISASLAQIGEFSFILAALGMSLELLPERGRDLILAGSILSILINPMFFVGLDRLKPWLDKYDGAAVSKSAKKDIADEPLPVTSLEGHVIVVGLGRVGRRIAESLLAGPRPLYVIDETEEQIDKMRDRSIEGLAGNAITLMQTANLTKAAGLIISLPNGFESGQLVATARAANPNLFIVARAQSEAEADHLRRYGASDVIIGEQTIADAVLDSYRAGAPT